MIRPCLGPWLRLALAAPALLLTVLPGGPLAAQETAPAPPLLSLEQRMLLRCSAAFALVANRQQSGEDWALAYPPLAQQGREFFVRATARLADETGVEPPALAPVLRAEAESLLDRPLLQQVMPVCLTLLPPAPQG